jgi:hypothetical protein
MAASTEEGAEESTLIEEGTTMPNLGITVQAPKIWIVFSF